MEVGMVEIRAVSLGRGNTLVASEFQAVGVQMLICKATHLCIVSYQGKGAQLPAQPYCYVA